MDQSAVREIVGRVLTPFSRALGVSHWNIVVDYGPCSVKTWAAECGRNPNYNNAEITLDPEKFSEPADVEASLRHELQHIVLAPWDVYRNVLTEPLDTESPEGQREQALFRHCIEQAVLAQERAWNGCREYWREEFAREAAETANAVPAHQTNGKAPARKRR